MDQFQNKHRSLFASLIISKFLCCDASRLLIGRPAKYALETMFTKILHRERIDRFVRSVSAQMLAFVRILLCRPHDQFLYGSGVGNSPVNCVGLNEPSTMRFIRDSSETKIHICQGLKRRVRPAPGRPHPARARQVCSPLFDIISLHLHLIKCISIGISQQ